MERTVALTMSDEIHAENLPPNILQPATAPALPRWEVPPGGLDLETVVSDIEKGLMQDALEKSGWNQTKAAQLLGINFRSFRYRAKKYGLDRLIHDRGHGEG
jgi:two-component system response regulator PilR (NtrC family)